MAGKGPNPRHVNIKKWLDNFPKPTRKIEGFVKVKGKLVKKY
jgi:hypothetical protein